MHTLKLRIAVCNLREESVLAALQQLFQRVLAEVESLSEIKESNVL